MDAREPFRSQRLREQAQQEPPRQGKAPDPVSKYYRNVPVRSFYLELRSAAFVAKDPAIIYSIDVERFFRHLQGIRFAKMRDPVDVSGMIAGFATDPQVEDAQSKLTTAAIRATNARHAEKAGKIREAFDWWDRVFDGHFPAYG